MKPKSLACNAGPAAFLAAALVLLAALASAAPRRERVIDHFKVHPDLGSIRLTAVAMLPAVSYDGVTPAERQAEVELMRAILDAGYRWISATTCRDMLRRAGGDSLLRANRENILEKGQIDSARAGAICAMMRVNGLLTVRLDRAEQVSIQEDQSGRPSTTVQLRAALVDSLGRLVWSAGGSQIAEGIELQAAVGGVVGGSSGANLTPTNVTAKNNAPDWLLAYRPMFLRWAPTFPKRTSMAGGTPPMAAAPDSSGR